MTNKTDLLRLRQLSFTLLFSFLYIAINAQVLQNLHLEVRAGVTTGSPIIIKDIPEGATGSPGFGPTAGIELSYQISPEISFAIGGMYSIKSSSFNSPIDGKYDAARGIFGQRFPFPIRVKYDGTVDASFNNRYLDFPVSIGFHISKWRFGIGYQYSRLLNGKLDGTLDVKALLLTFNDISFDESNNIRSTDHAGIFRVTRQLSDRINVALDSAISLNRLMIEEEEGYKNPRNVYVNLVAGFRIF